MMKIRFLVFAIPLVVAVSGCDNVILYGGGGGKEYPPGIAVNNIEVTKTDLGGSEWTPPPEKILKGDISKYPTLPIWPCS